MPRMRQIIELESLRIPGRKSRLTGSGEAQGRRVIPFSGFWLFFSFRGGDSLCTFSDSCAEPSSTSLFLIGGTGSPRSGSTPVGQAQGKHFSRPPSATGLALCPTWIIRLISCRQCRRRQQNHNQNPSRFHQGNRVQARPPFRPSLASCSSLDPERNEEEGKGEGGGNRGGKDGHRRRLVQQERIAGCCCTYPCCRTSENASECPHIMSLSHSCVQDKVVYIVRHAQGQHNVSPSYDYDPPLTLEGHDQVWCLSASLPPCLPTSVSPYLPTSLPPCLPASLPPCLPAYISTPTSLPLVHRNHTNSHSHSHSHPHSHSQSLFHSLSTSQVTAGRQITSQLEIDVVLVSPLRRTIQTAIGREMLCLSSSC